MGKYGSLSRRLASEEGVVRKEEQQLHQLANGVESTRHTANAINDEIEAQNVLLDDIEAGITRAQSDTIDANARAMTLEHDSYSLKIFCTLLTPVVLLFVMFLLLIRRVLLG